MNFVKNEIFEMWILWKSRFSKCEFCEKWDFWNVNFVENEIFKSDYLDELRNFAPVCFILFAHLKHMLLCAQSTLQSKISLYHVFMLIFDLHYQDLHYINMRNFTSYSNITSFFLPKKSSMIWDVRLEKLNLRNFLELLDSWLSDFILLEGTPTMARASAV